MLLLFIHTHTHGAWAWTVFKRRKNSDINARENGWCVWKIKESFGELFVFNRQKHKNKTGYVHGVEMEMEREREKKCARGIQFVFVYKPLKLSFAWCFGFMCDVENFNRIHSRLTQMLPYSLDKSCENAFWIAFEFIFRFKQGVNVLHYSDKTVHWRRFV